MAWVARRSPAGAWIWRKILATLSSVRKSGSARGDQPFLNASLLERAADCGREQRAADSEFYDGCDQHDGRRARPDMCSVAHHVRKLAEQRCRVLTCRDRGDVNAEQHHDAEEWHKPFAKRPERTDCGPHDQPQAYRPTEQVERLRDPVARSAREQKTRQPEQRGIGKPCTSEEERLGQSAPRHADCDGESAESPE